MRRKKMSKSGSPGHSRLYYHGTKDEVRLGDRIRIKRWFGKDLTGTVCYIPGISPIEAGSDIDDGDEMRQWAYKLDDGRSLVVGYCPEQLQPRKGIELISRGELPPDLELPE
jgi:hypothetical protein